MCAIQIPSCFSRCLRVPIAMRQFYKQNLWILQQFLLTNLDLHHRLLAYSAANHLIPNRGVIYTTGYALVRSIRDTWRKDSDVSESAVVNRYARADLLIVDEVGAQFGSEGERVQLFDILDQRYQQMLPTLIITNLNPQELRECLGDRSYDRLMEIGGSVVTFAGKSYRRNQELLRRQSRQQTHRL